MTRSLSLSMGPRVRGRGLGHCSYLLDRRTGLLVKCAAIGPGRGTLARTPFSAARLASEPLCHGCPHRGATDRSASANRMRPFSESAGSSLKLATMSDQARWPLRHRAQTMPPSMSCRAFVVGSIAVAPMRPASPLSRGAPRRSSQWPGTVRSVTPRPCYRLPEPSSARLQASIHSLVVRFMPKSSLSRLSKSGMWAGP